MIVDSFIRQCNTIFHIRIKQFVFSKPQHSIDHIITYTDHIQIMQFVFSKPPHSLDQYSL